MLIAALIAVHLGVVLLFLLGFFVGFPRGFKDGQRDMIRRLMATKNPEWWDVAHSLMIDLEQVPTPSSSKISRVAKIVLPLLLAVFLAGCAPDAPPRGSAQDRSVDASARAQNNALAADKARVDAAAKRARATALEEAAKTQPTVDWINAAVAAKVDAAVAEGVASALEKEAQEADDAAGRLVVAAANERRADDKAKADASWLLQCRWFGLIGVAVGTLLGGALSWFVSPKIGVPTGVIILGTGLAVVAYGATVTWLPAALGVAVLIGFIVWGFFHWKSWRVNVALSKTVDALEGQADVTVATAKAQLGAAVKGSGLVKRFEKARAAWSA